jgi:hypothetical protein
MSASLLSRVRGPALAYYRGVPFYTSDAMSIAQQLAPFDINSDSFGVADSRMSGRFVKSGFAPIGAWTAAALAVMYPWMSFTRGDFNTPVRTISGVNTGTNVLTSSVAHGQITGTGVRFASTGTLPSGLSATTTYYVNVAGGTTLTVYDTQAHAIAGAGVGNGLIIMGTAGSGTIKMIQNTPLIINCFNGETLTLWNTAVTKMPSLNLSAVKTPLGGIEFESYTLHGQSWSDNNSLFTMGTGAVADTTFDPTQIPTVPFSASWGGSAPFTNLRPRDGVTIDFGMKLAEVTEDGEGLLCRSISDVQATAKLRPLGIQDTDLWGELLTQGTGAARGTSMPAAELDIFGPGNNPYIALFGAMMQDDALKFGAQEDRVDGITFKTKQTFTAGVPQPIFYVGTAHY